MKQGGIELYDDNAQHVASYISLRTMVLDSLAHTIMASAKAAAEPYRKSLGDSYVDHFGVGRALYTGRQRHRKWPVMDRIVYNDHYAAHIVELGIGKDVITFSNGRSQRVTEFQRGHFFLVGAAAQAVSLRAAFRPPPAVRKANWNKLVAEAGVGEATGFRHSLGGNGLS